MSSFRTRLRRVRRRLLSIGAAAGTSWGLAIATLLLLAGAWLDLLWELTPAWRIAALAAAGVCGAALLTVVTAATILAARDAGIIRRLDRAGHCGGRIVTGWELALGRYGLPDAPPTPLCAGLAEMAVADAAAVAGQVPLGAAAPLRPLGRSLAALGALWAVVGVLVVCMPGLAWNQWTRFTRPFDDVPPFSPCEFTVEPGSVPVVYGNELEILATVRGAPVDHLELVLETAHGQEPSLPMFPEAGGVWRAVLAKVVEPFDYYVRAGRARSVRYHISVVTVPLIEDARVRIVPPAYANHGLYEGKLPKEGVCGLRGTKVEIFLRSNRPLRGGTIALTKGAGTSGQWAVGSGQSAVGGAKPQAASGRVSQSPNLPLSPSCLPTLAPLRMSPAEPGSSEVVGRFEIAGDGKFECRVIDEAGQTSQQTFSGNVTLLADQRPFVRITEPPAMSLATPNAVLPVMLSAEDDCGLGRLQLFRSLNDSRALPCDVPLPARPPRRLDEPIGLPLARYGLEPGDVIKLFARVEDNDPAGVKGAESSVAVVRIITQEEFEQMTQARQGIEAILSKYHEARRRMESLADKTEGLHKKVKSLPSGEKMSENMRRELKQLEELMRREAAAMRKAAKSPMPFDLDKNLAPELQQLAELSDEMAKELEKLLADRDAMNKKLAGKLDEMAKRLAAGRKLYQEQVINPLLYIEGVMPLLADQQRFVMLALWQQDLAERLASIKGRDREDNPALKARMRDLEQEQRQVREALAAFLDSMQEHVDKLPENPELDELRESAREFVKDVRASGASEAMTDAESALAAFTGAKAHEKAQEAADILDKFIKRCKGEGEGNCNCKGLKFQPKMCSKLGNTISQMLAAMGMGAGGTDDGMMGGYGGVGLFGGMPETFGDNGQFGDSQRDQMQRGAFRNRRNDPRGDNPDAPGADAAVVPGAATGTSDGAVPIRYRRQVGQYRERIAEETGESSR
jgi:hypothetical protein